MSLGYTPVLLLTGYLGSGKTTLLNRILSNRRGIRFAVIVNDIGEVNIDETLIRKGGIVGGAGSDDLVALQNGCICCSLQADLIRQLADLVATRQFDYIVIEASGICQPAPIARSICAMEQIHIPGADDLKPRLDCITTVVDALRLRSEFACGDSLQKPGITQDDIENLIIDQIEFCNIILLNKVSEVSEEDAARIRAVIRALQPQAKIIDCDYCDVDLGELLDTDLFDFEKVATSATWIREIEKHHDEEEEEDEDGEHHHDEHHHENLENLENHEHHEHHENLGEHDHHHHHHHEGCTCSECCGDHDGEHEGDHHHHHHSHYGISTFVYYRRPPFNFEKFDRFIARQWPANVIRCKGVIYFSQNRNMSLLFEQAGQQKKLSEAGLWYATAPAEELRQLMAMEPGLERDWDPEYGDRMIKLVFIGRDLDRSAITSTLDSLLEPK